MTLQTLLDHCIELGGYIHSYTVNDIYKTRGKTPMITSAMSVDLAGMTGSCSVTQHPAFLTIK